MKIFETTIGGYERVAFCSDEAANYRGIIVIHNTTLGPAVSGVRFWQYKTDEDALTDACGVWYLLKSTEGFAALQFGSNGDVPTENAFVP